MQTFEYSWVDDQGKHIWEKAESTSADELERLLTSQGVDVLSIQKTSFLGDLFHSHQSTGQKARARKIKNRELIELCIHLAVLTEAGIPLTTAVYDYIAEVEEPYFKQVISELHRKILTGASLSQAFQSYPKIFSDEFVYLTQAGERTGTMSNALKELRKYLEWKEKISGEIRQATTYPVIISVVIGAFVLFLFSAIVPGIAKVLIDLKIELPWMTIVVLAISDFILAWWWLVGILSTLMIFSIKYMTRTNYAFALKLDALKLKIPVLGELIAMLLQARFIHNFAIIQKAGIAILENLDLCYRFVPNKIYQTAILQIKDDVRDGLSLTESMRNREVFSSLILRMVAIGESSGSLDTSLVHATQYYDEEIPRRLKKIFSLLEPILILTLIGIVGFVALAIFIPILSISGGIK